MAVISVRNLGQVRIAGETPTEEEKKKIASIVQSQKTKQSQDELTTPYPEIYSEEQVPRGNERTEAVEAYLASPEFKRLGTEIGFAVGGAMTGGTLAGARLILRPALQILYRSLGAGVGQATGAGIASTTFDPKEELSKDVLRAFAQGATFEAVGAAIPALIKKIRFKGIKTTKEADEAEKVIADQKTKMKGAEYSKYDEELALALKEGQLTPGLQTENRFIDILENITEKSLFGGGSLIKARKGAQTLTNKFVDDYISNYGNVTRNDYGELLQSTIKNNVDEFKIAARGMYDDLTLKSKGVKVDITDIKKEANKLIDEAKYTKGLQKDALKVPQTILNLPDQIPFNAANQIRSQFLGITRSSNELISGQSQRYAANLADKITKALDDMSKAPLSAEAKLAYNKAQSFYKEGAEIFNDKIIRNLVRNESDQVFKNVIKPERPNIIDKVSKVIARTKNPIERDILEKNLQGSLLFDLQSESIKRYNNLNGDFLLKNLNKYGDTVLNKVFKPQELKQVRSLLETLKVAQQKTVGEGVPGGVFIQLTQAGALFGLGTGIATGPAAAILIGPAVIARLFTNPKFVSFLKKGFQLNPGSPEYYKWGTRLINAMLLENLIDQEEADEFLSQFEKLK
jgi:hypothetical protein